MKNIRILAFCLVIFSSGTSAQQFSINAGAGLQGLRFDTKDVSNEMKIGGKIGFGYYFSFNEHLGILTGIEGNYYNSSHRLNDGVYTAPMVDTEGDAFDFRVKTSSYTEDHSFLGASIPILFHYGIGGEHDTQIYINAGPKVMIPFNH